MSPVRLSAKPSATVWRPQPKRVSASSGFPPQYFSAISASKARRFGPFICDAARRRSAICDGLSDGRHSSVESCMHMRGPLERRRVNFLAGSSEHAYSSRVISFPEIALVNYMDETSWLLHGTRQWLWVMAHPAVAYFQLHPNRSKAAFVQLIGDWTVSWSVMAIV